MHLLESREVTGDEEKETKSCLYNRGFLSQYYISPVVHCDKVIK